MDPIEKIKQEIRDKFHRVLEDLYNQGKIENFNIQNSPNHTITINIQPKLPINNINIDITQA